MSMAQKLELREQSAIAATTAAAAQAPRLLSCGLLTGPPQTLALPAPSKQQNSAAQSTPSFASHEVRWFSTTEMDDRRRQVLCFNCN
jgi:hypothetical protein